MVLVGVSIVGMLRPANRIEPAETKRMKEHFKASPHLAEWVQLIWISRTRLCRAGTAGRRRHGIVHPRATKARDAPATGKYPTDVIEKEARAVAATRRVSLVMTLFHTRSSLWLYRQRVLAPLIQATILH